MSSRIFASLSLAAAATKKKMSWFKNEEAGAGLAPFVTEIVTSNPTSDLGVVLSQVEAWLYE